MGIGVLGPLAVAGDGPPLAPRDRVVLAALVASRGAPVGADGLADALWAGSSPPASWNKVVQGCVVRIRKVLGADSIRTDGRAYRLAVPPDDIDARRFERAVERARELLVVGEPDRAMYAADDALALWRGRPLPELDDWEPGRIEAVRLGELQLDAEELRIEAALRAGRHREVLADASAAVARQPLREHRWTLLALAQHRAGRQGDALRTLHEARKVLVRELGVDPGDEIVALESAILRQDPTLVAPHLVEPSDVCPFRGLAPYESADADRFFGRAVEIAQCLDRLRERGVLAVVGPSGSGKSSLVRAGITPALERAGSRVELITPGAHPVRALESIRTRGTAPCVLVVDQCEEAVTSCRDPDERRHFFDALAEHAQRGALVIGFRADRLGDLTEHPAFAALVERGLYLLVPMSTSQLREAIEAPARQAGLRFEPGLVDLLLREVEDEPGSLPLLSHALYQTWQQREGNVLTVAGYRATGGIRGAVAQSAEQLYGRLPGELRPMLRDLVLRLVAPSTDGEPVRARVPRRIVAPDAPREELLDDLVRARLVTADGVSNASSVELAHEALVRAWPRLQEWLADDAEGQRLWRHLASAAETWDGMGRPASELYRGVRLDRAVEWASQSAVDLHPTEREFLDASRQLADHERRVVDLEAERQARANRRLRLLVAMVTVLTFVATGAAIVAVRQADRVDREAAAARSNELSAAATAALVESPALAKSLAVAAADPQLGDPTPASVAVLHETLAADPTVARWGFVGEVGQLGATIDPMGERFAAAGIFQPDGAGWTLEVVDIASGRTSWSVDLSESGHASTAVAAPVFSADGRQVVVGAYWDPYSWRRPPIAFEGIDEPPDDLLGARFHDAATGELVERIDLGRCGGIVVGVSDTHVLARTLHGAPDVVRECRWRDGTIGVELVERSSGDRNVLTTDADAPWHLGAAMSGDGALVAFDTVVAGGGGASHAVVAVDVATGTEIARVAARDVRDLDEVGDRLLVGWHVAQVWDLASGELLVELDVARGGWDADSRFTADGRSVVSTSGDGTVRMWDALTGEQLASYPGVGTGPVGVSRTGLVAVTTPDQQIVTVIDRHRRGELGAVELCDAGEQGGWTGDGALDVVDGRVHVLAACGGDAASVTTVDLGTSTVTRHAGRSGRTGLASAPDGTAIVAQRFDRGDDGEPVPGPLVVADAGTGRSLVELASVQDIDDWPVAGRVRWSPDGSWIAAALGPHLAVWDASTGELSHAASEEVPGSSVVDVIFTPDSSAVISTSTERILTRRSLGAWLDAHVAPSTIEGAYSIGLAGFAHDGALIAVGGYQSRGSSLVRFDARTLVYEDVWSTIHEGAVTSMSIRADGRQVATSATDGTVRIWDTATGELVHDVGHRSRPVRGVAFNGDHELVLAADGVVERITTDATTLVDLARGSLTHGFTDSECLRFNFESISACPTLDELTRRRSDPGAPDGVFSVAWTPEELHGEMVTSIEGYFDAPIWDDDGVQRFLSGLAEEIADGYTLRLDDGRFELNRASATGPVCTGSVRYDAPRLSLLAERGSFCYPSVLFEGDVRIDDDRLHVDPATMRAEFPNVVLFGARALERAG